MSLKSEGLQCLQIYQYYPKLKVSRGSSIHVACAAKRKNAQISFHDTASQRDAKTPPRAVRAVPMQLLAVAKAGTPPVEQMAGDYASKLERYCKFQETLLRPNPKNSKNPIDQKQAEGERLVKALSPRDYLVMVDERGREVSSLALADIVARAGDQGVGALVFAIGGPHGHGPQVRERADDTIRLSKMVLNHQIARLVLLEQLYRAWTILRGEPYHH
eukprot:CAMPEP_0196576660 /NCGR_PEP_ID=MMETSP1081-20130531/5871_1 /TAXON_ID=36882 /ORGANISM="Pyramimonas amylifera, Strain CCMP720" /LENGTH=216 /DNA_ID=CAMNT_0041895335 /DNA_START=35 /DNA_END=685 /DNA_ORIENTATION=-